MDYAIVLLLVFLCHEVFTVSSSKLPHLSHKHQTSSLLKFKNTLTVDTSTSYLCQEPYPKTSSWNMSRDCCSWDGVICDEMTGHVIELDLSCSNLAGTIDSNSSLFQLSHLQRLDLSLNNFSNSHISPEFGKFSSLTHLDLSDSNFSGQIPSEISHLSKLQSLRLYGRLRLIAHDFKLFLQNLTQLIDFVNFPHNFPESMGYLTSLCYLYLQNCNLRGPIPESLSKLTRIEDLYLQYNSLNGTIPSGIFSLPSLSRLVLSNNHFSGQFEDFNSNSLNLIDLSNNQLQGHLPNSIQNLLLDLGNNNLNDTFPVWLGALPDLLVLSLRSNKLHGPIRTSSIENMFPELRIIDLSYNAFSGNLPSSLFQHLKAMRTIDPSMGAPRYHGDTYYEDSITVATKGFVRILYLYTAIDLSTNKFRGKIPSIMGDLIAVHIMNLSHNGLQGHIPSSFGDLSSVESLDLSGNQLSGEIPQQLASLTYLSFLNLSHNHLQGCIPQGPQFYTYESNSYEGNDGLRGFPISKSCGYARVLDTNDTVSGLDDEESNSDFQNDFWKGALMGYGSGLCIGLSIIYFMVSTGKPIWLARIIIGMEHKIILGRRKKQRRQRNYRRRNINHF
ncbi:hypothetical protein R3W88_031624 [Solanum pinnatisectum]|uniref:Leucine-rich repeat-containing N-terminal plant-type domain-containing protein n=1 Tax=Solanum pinnatisectum TaxID=50273 RepID=A0AAV9LN89_9SOLN|nr:hypothetical protein R3W88_031624 [Solanum pinnatisectum]